MKSVVKNQFVKAMIFAAGFGTRLRPLTERTPKALVPVGGEPMLAHVLRRLKRFGCVDVIVNVHHLADQIVRYLEAQQNFGLNVRISHEEDCLLDTGGGLKRAAWFFDDDEPFLVHNVDILTDLDLGGLYQAHVESESLATLAVKARPGTRFLLFNEENILCGWKNTATHEVKMSRPVDAEELTPLAFSGVHVISPNIFDLMPQSEVFSMTPFYLKLAATHTIAAFRHDHSLWLDIGKPDSLPQAGQLLRQILST